MSAKSSPSSGGPGSVRAAMSASLASGRDRILVRTGDGTHAEVAVSDADAQELVALDLLARDDHTPVAVLHDRIPAFERRLRRQAADAGSEVAHLVLRAEYAHEHPVAGAAAQRDDELALAC